MTTEHAQQEEAIPVDETETPLLTDSQEALASTSQVVEEEITTDFMEPPEPDSQVVEEETTPDVKAEGELDLPEGEIHAPDIQITQEVSQRRIANLERKKEFASWRSGMKEQLHEIRKEVSDILGR